MTPQKIDQEIFSKKFLRRGVKSIGNDLTLIQNPVALHFLQKRIFLALTHQTINKARYMATQDAVWWAGVIKKANHALSRSCGATTTCKKQKV